MDSMRSGRVAPSGHRRHLLPADHAPSNGPYQGAESPDNSSKQRNATSRPSISASSLREVDLEPRALRRGVVLRPAELDHGVEYGPKYSAWRVREAQRFIGYS